MHESPASPRSLPDFRAPYAEPPLRILASGPHPRRATVGGPAGPGALATLGTGVAALACAGVLAAVTALAHARWHADPDRALRFVLAGSILFVVVAMAAAVHLRRAELTPARLAHVAMAAAAVVWCGWWLYWLGAHIAFPADILIWSESDFVNDVIKLRVGHPLYTAQVHNESFVYPPGAQVLSYLIASLSGQGTSLTALRAVQLAYTAAAAALAMLAVRRLLELAGVRLRRPLLWAALWLPLLLLVATNALTNEYVVFLHNDALAQLLAVTGFWACVEYGATGRRWLLVLLSGLPAAGFLVKQSLLVWVGLAALFLLVAEGGRAWRRAAAVATGGAALVLAALGACLLVWGEPFRYWTLDVLAADDLSPLRSAHHLLAAWTYFVGGLVGALVLIRGSRRRVLAAAWFVWLLLLGSEAYTSGIAWMLNHMGPGSLIAGVWIVAALSALLTEAGARLERRTADAWLRSGAVAALGVLLPASFGTARMPTRPFGPDAERYVAAVERELAADPATTLLDTGSWVYLRHGIVMRDRAPSIGERGHAGNGDFSGILRRIEERRYRKILVRGYAADDSWYDEPYWHARSGIRAALERNYVQAGEIPALQVVEDGARMRYLFREIDILVPRTDR
ncbi:MAG TPA: hypothetical protein VFS08_03500 [Gemmatimonadaceae bacterium]|nr:hypothetical protein [Gemmatimonadaceae bacterium]